MPSRRHILAGLPLLAWRVMYGGMGAWAAAWSKRVAVVFSSALDPCVEAVEGLRARLPSDEIALGLVDLNQSASALALAQEFARKPALVVAVGSDALRAVLGKEAQALTVSTMTLEADEQNASPTARVNAAIYLDIPVRTMVLELRKLFPGKSRVGVIRNPVRGDPSGAQMRGPGAELSSLAVVDCATPEQLLPAFLGLRKKVDFVICLPDGALYNGATARPLIMASLENRLPIVGFSPAFLRAGAAVAIYPDYRAIGQQTAELIRRCLEPANCACREAPKQVNVAVNTKILRLLGIEFMAAAHPDVTVLLR